MTTIGDSVGGDNCGILWNNEPNLQEELPYLFGYKPRTQTSNLLTQLNHHKKNKTKTLG